ncbi:hypothetical protein LIER_09135 [Lithospermum erythrorhizon]|uniref:Uncharacterized protein n=1 Tax=Lithospermum erythrorhizon TaxID=34254 RepID=A0AAV3PIH3_LITER
MSSYFPPIYGMSYQENIPYMSHGQQPPPYGYSGGMQEPSIGITNYPGYCTQEIPEVVRDDSFEHHVVEPPTTQGVRGSRTYNSWSIEHNKLLLNGWLKYTNDSITGTSQTSSTFWDAITAFVNQNSPHGPERSSKQFSGWSEDVSHGSENLRSRHEYKEAMYVTPLYQLSQEVQSELETQNTRTKKKNYVHRDRHEAHNRLFKEYFADDATFTEDQFRRRFA